MLSVEEFIDEVEVEEESSLLLLDEELPPPKKPPKAMMAIRYWKPMGSGEVG